MVSKALCLRSNMKNQEQIIVFFFLWQHHSRFVIWTPNTAFVFLQKLFVKKKKRKIKKILLNVNY
jgi:hypothetical protein